MFGTPNKAQQYNLYVADLYPSSFATEGSPRTYDEEVKLYESIQEQKNKKMQ